ncbi:MAG TPA: hypothetical protein VMM84_04470 [Pyrinomonadaceae bacterium]|nr:hypothetical protein [Pyrinomonadaceae bacterium]
MFASIYSSKIPAGVSLSDFAYSFSPIVEETATDTVVIDVDGCELLFGSAYQLANIIVTRAAASPGNGGLGCKVNVALAENPDSSIFAARFFKGITFIAPGEELNCLGELPIEALGPIDPADPILETMKLWGVRTFQEFAKLPTAGVSERLGQLGVELQQLARGKTKRHLKLRQPVPVFEHSVELEYPIVLLEPLSFILARLLNQLCANLEAYALATNELRLQLTLEDGALHERRLALPSPMRDHKVFLKLLLLDTEMHPPAAAIKAMSMACEPVKPRVVQNGLFMPLAPEPEKLELTLARVAKLVGPANLGSPELLDTHRTDAFRLKRFGGWYAGTRRQRDAETGGRGDAETGGRGDAETRRRGDRGTGRHGDAETRGRGDRGTGGQRILSPRPRVPASPRRRVSPSPRLPVAPSPRPPVGPSPRSSFPSRLPSV